MLSVAEAAVLIQQRPLLLPAEQVVLADAVGRILREPVYADRDFPPFDRVAMDGVAIQFSQFAAGQRLFSIQGTHRAGQPQPTLINAHACLEVMTGAMLPIGTDAVIRYEDLHIANGQATITIDEVQPRQNIHHQASDRRAGDILLTPGTLLGPIEIAVAGSAGRTSLQVSALPRVALISTGDELVGVADTPLPYQIRQSNAVMLQASLRELGIRATLHHIPDDEGALATELAELLITNDVLLLSGGVSAGKADFVPAVLMQLGVQQVFHKIEQRPGKPLWFGQQADKTVFGLPGNPVSTFLCYVRYVRPFLQTSFGLTAPPPEYAQLARPISFNPALTYFLPVRLDSQPDGSSLAHPLPGNGSGDFANLLAAHGFMELPAEKNEFSAGDVYPVWRL